MKSEPIQGLINVILDFPYRLTLPATSYVVSLSTGEFGVIKIQHKKGLIIFDKGRTTSNKKSRIKLLYRRKIKAEMKIQMADQSFVYIEADENGKMLFPKNYTRFEIIFRINDLRANLALSQNRDFIDNFAKRLFDKFILSYMYGTGDCSIGLSKKPEMPSISIIKSYDFTDKDLEGLKDEKKNEKLIILKLSSKKFAPFRGFEKIGGFTSSSFVLPDYSSINKPDCTEKQFEKTFLAMGNPAPINPYLKFIFSSISKSHVREEYSLAILDLAIAFELALLSFFIRLKFLLDKELFDLKSNELDNKLKIELAKNAEKFDKKNLDDRLKIFEKLKSDFEEKLGRKYLSVTRTKEYKDWHKKVWKIRHKVAHMGFDEIKKDHVKEGLSLTQKVIKYIDTQDKDVNKYIQISREQKN